MENVYVWLITLSLGFDALIVSASLGLRHEPKNKIKIALAFAAAESLMPIAGMIIGGAAGRFFGGALTTIGALLLIGVAIYFLFFDDDEDEHKAFGQSLAGWPLLAAAIGISLDELAVGFSAGLMQLPIMLAIILFALQSFAFSLIGVTFGARLGRFLGEWAEKVSGVALGIMGVWIIMENGFFGIRW